MHFANWLLFCDYSTIIANICFYFENLRLCSYAKEAGIVLNLFLNFEQNEPRVLIKLFL